MEAAGKRYIVYGSRSDEFTISNIADGHLGNRACAEEKLGADIAEVEGDPYAFWLSTGDNAEYISTSDKRFDPLTFASWIQIADLGNIGRVLTQRVRDCFKPIADKCFGIGRGNHEEKYEKDRQQRGLHAWLCHELGVPDLGYCSLFDIVFARNPRIKQPRLVQTSPGIGYSSWTVRVFTHHGAGWAATPGGKFNKLRDAMHRFNADVYFLGHLHDELGHKQPTIGADPTCERIIAEKRLAVMSGSYLRTYAQDSVTMGEFDDGTPIRVPVASYGEQRMYAPVNLGAASVTITPDKHKIEGTI